MGLTTDVIIPHFNDAALLEETLESFVTQSRPPQQIIVIDDGSLPEEFEAASRIAARYPSVKLERSPENQGVSAAVSRGLALSTSDLVHMAACDDQRDAFILERCADALERWPEAPLVFCETMLYVQDIDRLVPISQDWALETTCFDAATFGELCQKFTLNTHLICMRREVFAKEPYPVDLHWSSDIFMVKRLAMRRGVAYIPDPMGSFTVRSGSYHQKGMKTPEARRIVERMIDLVLNEEDPALRERMIAAGFFDWIAATLLEVITQDSRYWNAEAMRLFKHSMASHMPAEAERRRVGRQLTDARRANDSVAAINAAGDNPGSAWEVARRYPDCASAWNELANLLEQRRDYSGCFDALRHLLKLTWDRRALRERLCAIAGPAGRKADAAAYLRQRIALEPAENEHLEALLHKL